MIRIENATLVRMGKKLLEDFSWQINDGEHWVISGENGSGKSVLLELLAGGIHLPKGSVHYDFITATGWDARHAEKRQKIKYIPAHAIQSLTKGNSSLYYQQRYYADADNDVQRVSDILGVDEDALVRLKLPPSLSICELLPLEITRLSNGQLRKILLVQSLVGTIPKLLLLDYPFEGLDTQSRKDLCAFIDAIVALYGIQIILTDHQHHLPSVITRRLVLKDFKILREESVSENLPVNSTLRQPFVFQSAEPEIIKLKNLTIRYGSKTILEGFNWTVRRGDRWALVGGNGSGKTTLFSMIFADHPMAYTQEIYLFGRKRGTGESIWDIKKRMAYLGPEIINFLNPQNIAITAHEYVRSQQKGVDQQALTRCIDYFGAQAFFDQPVRALSSGQLQLMEIIRCFSSRKELILLDEPFQFLDPKQQHNVRSYLASILDPETTLILITHYERDIEEWAGQTIRIG